MADPAGRLDILLERVFERLVMQQNNPVVTALYETFKPVLHEQIRQACRKNEFAKLAKEVFGRKEEPVRKLSKPKKAAPRKVSISRAPNRKPEKETIIDAEFQVIQ